MNVFPVLQRKRNFCVACSGRRPVSGRKFGLGSAVTAVKVIFAVGFVVKHSFIETTLTGGIIPYFVVRAETNLFIYRMIPKKATRKRARQPIHQVTVLLESFARLLVHHKQVPI